MARELAQRGPTELQTYLETNIGELAKSLPKHLSKERMLAVLVNMAYRNPDLQKCEKNSILVSACQAGALGLDLNPSLGEAYLIPRWNKNIGGMECTFMPGYQGLVKLVRQTGQIATIQAAIVYDKDEFLVEYDPDLRFMHRPTFKGRGVVRDGVGVRAVYAIAKLNNGERIIETMTVDEVEGIRARSQSKDRGPWVTDWCEMAKKTVLRRLIKQLPKSAELAAALEANDADFEHDGRPQLENRSGFGSGKYASPEQTEAYKAAIEPYLDRRNQSWLDRWTNHGTGEIAGGVKDLANLWQIDKHLVKFCVNTGRLDPAIDPEMLQNRQIGRYTGIVWHRSVKDQNAIKRELRDYLDKIEREQEEVVRTKNPHLFEDEEPEDDPFDDLTDDNFAAETKSEVVPPSPKPESLPSSKPNGKKAEQKTLVPDDDPEVWREGRE